MQDPRSPDQRDHDRPTKPIRLGRCRSFLNVSPLKQGPTLMDRLFTGWKGEMQHQVDLFSQERGEHELRDNDYLILKSNIHVTLAMTRLRLM